MQSTLINSFFAAVIIFAVVANNCGVFAFDDMKCQGMDITMTEVQINNIKECAAKAGVTSAKDMTQDKMPCFAKCVMEKKGLVDDKGKPHKENINNLIDSTMPEKVRADMKSRTEKCLDEHGAGIDSSDASCLTYAPLAMCCHQAAVEICKQ